MNQSDLTRREQVLRHLQAHIGEWVDGSELATERVGGSEGLKRLRELRAEGHRIVMRAHPDTTRSVFQYRLVPDPPAPPPGPLPIAYDERSGRYSTSVRMLTCTDCKLPYADYAQHIASKEHIEGVRRRDEERRRLEEGPKYKFDQQPTRVEFGQVAICPRCRGVKRIIPRKQTDPPLMPGQQAPRFDFCSDPNDIYKECIGCNGFGVVPNVGPIVGRGAMLDDRA